jgi:four helix bundle protein
LNIVCQPTPEDFSGIMEERSPQNQAAPLEERLVQFAIGIIPIANQLCATFAGRNIAAQLIRSGTSPAPNYAEARSAESRADFIHKLRIAIKELNETSIGLRIARGSQLVPLEAVAGLSPECDELRRIIGASIRTARLRAASEKPADRPNKQQATGDN